jgi:hypothetical protein
MTRTWSAATSTGDSRTSRGRRRPESFAGRGAAWLITALGFGGLAVLGTAAWWIVPVLTVEALGKLRGRPFGPDAMFAASRLTLGWSPIGLAAGLLAGLWANACRLGWGRAWRHGIAALLLIGLAALGGAVLFMLQRAR